MAMKKLAITAVLLICGLTASSALAADEDQVDPDITSGKAAREFRQARQKWLAAGIVDYRMKVSRGCFCAGPSSVTITVRGGKAVKVSDRPWYGPWTVPGMYRIIGQAIKNEVAALDVTYGAKLGIPRQTSIDYIAMAVDDEIGYGISGFKALKP
jgi:hypothetical protein